MGGGTKKRDAGWLGRLVRRVGSVVVMELEPLTVVMEKRTLSELLSIMDNNHHPLHRTCIKQRRLFSGRLIVTNLLYGQIV